MVLQKKRRLSYARIFIYALSTLSLLALIALFVAPELQTGIFFRQCQDYLADFTNVILYAMDLDPYHSPYGVDAEHAYLPLSYLITYPFVSLLDPGDSRSFTMWHSPLLMNCIQLFFTLITVTVFIQFYEMTEGTKRTKFLVAVLLICSRLYLFSVERGNLMLLAFSFILFFLMQYNSKSKLLRELAFLALAAAAALKLFPAAFGLLLLYEKRYREALRLMLYGALVCFLPFLLLKGGFSNLPVFWENMQANVVAYTGEGNCNLSSLIFPYAENRPYLFLLSTAATGLITASLLLNYLIEPYRWRKLLSLSMMMIMLPSHSATYNMLILLPAIVLFLNEKQHGKFDWTYLPLFLLLLSPLNLMEHGSYNQVLAALFLLLGIQAACNLIRNKHALAEAWRSFFPQGVQPNNKI